MRKQKLLKLFMSLFLTLTFFTASAQGNKISYNAANVELPTALRQVERQSGYYKLGFDADELKKYKVSVLIKNKTAPEAVEMLTSGLPLTISTEGKFIRIAKSNARGKNGASKSAGLIQEQLSTRTAMLFREFPFLIQKEKLLRLPM